MVEIIKLMNYLLLKLIPESVLGGDNSEESKSLLGNDGVLLPKLSSYVAFIGLIYIFFH